MFSIVQHGFKHSSKETKQNPTRIKRTKTMTTTTTYNKIEYEKYAVIFHVPATCTIIAKYMVIIYSSNNAKYAKYILNSYINKYIIYVAYALERIISHKKVYSIKIYLHLRSFRSLFPYISCSPSLFLFLFLPFSFSLFSCFSFSLPFCRILNIGIF